MKLGLFYMPLTRPGQEIGEAMEEATRKALFLDSIGVDEFWLGEHFSATSEPIPSPLAFMSSLLPQTKHLTFATGVLGLPYRHPAVIGAEVAQFDHLAKGRFRFGIGTGSLPPDWEMFDINDEAQRKRMLIESIDMIQKIWRTNPPYELKGEFWNFKIEKSVDPALRMGLMPKPRTPAGPPVHISIASPISSTAGLAGERNWGPVSSSLLPGKALGGHWRDYSAGLQRGGHRVTGQNWRVVRVIHVAPTDAEAERHLRDADSSVRFYFDYIRQVLTRAGRIVAFKTRPDMADHEVNTEDVMMQRTIFGSPKTVRDKLIALRDEAGPFDNLLISGMDWHGRNEDWERQSIELMAKEVWPAVRDHFTGAVSAVAAK